MKKLFYILISLLLITNVGRVYADDTLTEAGDANANATVGNVVDAVYEVNIMWEDLIFDWGYDATLGKQTWKTHTSCEEIEVGEIYDFDVQYYSNNECSVAVDLDETSVNEYQSSDKLYFIDTAKPFIAIEDNTTGGAVDLSIAWEPTMKYDFTTMSFSYYNPIANCQEFTADEYDDDWELYTNSNCTGATTIVSEAPEGTHFYGLKGSYVPFNTSAIPAAAAFSGAGGYVEYPDLPKNNYQIVPTLGLDANKEVTTPEENEVIGTITITMETR